MGSMVVRALVAAAATMVSVRASAYKATTYYGNAWCQAPAIAFDATPVTTACSASSCAATMTYGLKTRDTTCGITDVDVHATTVFGANVPYVLQRVFADDACTSELRVLGRRVVDGDCFRDSVTSSYRFAVRANGTVEQRLFATPDCTGAIASVVAVVGSDATADTGPCIARTTWSVRNAAFASRPRYRIETYYYSRFDATCTHPVRLVFTPIDVFGDVAAPVTCAQNAQGLMYSTTTETSNDPDMTAYSTFGEYQEYALITEFLDTNCTFDIRVTAYRAGYCIDLGDSAYNPLIADDGVLVMQIYPTRTCSGGVWSTMPTGTAGSCFNSRTVKVQHRNDPAPTAPPPRPTPTTKAPTPTPTSTPTTTTPTSTNATPPPTLTTSTPVNLKGSSPANSIAFSVAALVTVMAVVAGAFWLN